MIYGIISLLIVQLALVGATAILFLRLRSQADVEKHDHVGWGIKISAAVGTAEAAKRQVELVETEHFKALRTKFEAQELEIAELRKECISLRNEVVTLRTALASKARSERLERQREEAPPPAKNGRADVSDDARILNEVIHNGTAYIVPPTAAPVAPQKPSRPFGSIP